MHIVFMVHGMGSHGLDWADEAIKVLKDSYLKYPLLNRRTFEQRFEIVPLEYNSKFQEIVTAWQNNSTAVSKLAEGVGADQVASLVGWLRTAGAVDNNFIWTHAADVLLYRLFADVRESIKVHLAKQIVDKLNTLNPEDHWSIIGHSLGTAVTHDTLQMIWSGSLPGDIATGFEPTHNQARLVAMVANVSRVLQLRPPVYNSLVRPGPSGASNAGCIDYLNIRHELDPFTFPKMFNPLEWPSKPLSDNGSYQYIEPDHYHEKNIHDLAHYFKNPSVHIPLFRKLVNFSRIISKQQASEAMDGFARFEYISESASIALREKLEEVAPGIGTSWSNLGDIWDRYQTVLGEIS